ncbi:hypothetical protein EYZ11_008936 [Aspergillus tanneri]|uniref:Uncharacterized protein n=1 Tax=Aspergillus tanneri TaxID=1220188 RepID=A0A4S3J957_9EURO|nr:hypothetical protein EYZ11_008936 [Aspergillus tanneri]
MVMEYFISTRVLYVFPCIGGYLTLSSDLANGFTYAGTDHQILLRPV